MNYYVVGFADGYEVMTCSTSSDFSTVFLDTFDGRLLAPSWQPVEVYRTAADEKSEAKAADFPYFLSETVVLKKNALDVLFDVVYQDCEVLPLRCKDGTDYFVLNITKFPDALDEGQSTIVYIPGTQRVMLVERYVFVKRRIIGLNVFRTSHRSGVVVVSEDFRAQYIKNNLTGLVFREVVLI